MEPINIKGFIEHNNDKKDDYCSLQIKYTDSTPRRFYMFGPGEDVRDLSQGDLSNNANSGSSTYTYIKLDIIGEYNLVTDVNIVDSIVELR